MRNLVTCYSVHAVRVSDSYCSGPLNKSYSSPKLIKSTQNAVSFTYKTKLSPQKHLFITITWSHRLISQGSSWIKISDQMASALIRNCPDSQQICKSKGTKKFESCNSKIEVHWDLSNAKFNVGLEPVSSFYVVVLIDGTVGLILGDMVKNIVAGLPIAEFMLTCQCVEFSGNSKQFLSKAKFCDSGLDHDILVSFGTDSEGGRNPCLSVLIDKRRVIEIKRLQWNFRGNQVVFVDGILVDVLWDVHGWFFGEGNAVFMFRTRSCFDSRLWLDEKKSYETDHEKVEFSLMICTRKNNTG
ncbi:hypothetical protein Drorol1_Dr00026287 [Drosera rotundifolia]